MKQVRLAERRTLAPERVCLFIGNLGLGGAEKQVVLLAQGLVARGVEVHVITLTAGGAREPELREAGVTLHALDLPVLHRNARGVWQALGILWLLRELLRELRPQVLHAFLFHCYVLAAPAAWLARVPVLIAGRRSLGDFKAGQRLALLVERIATFGTDLLIANAQAVADDTRRREGVRAAKLTVVYNGLPEAAFAEAAPAAVDDPCGPVVVCVANLRDYKGHSYLVEALGLLRDRGIPTTAVLIGDGPERPALAAQAARLRLDVRLLGHRTDVPAWLARADLAVLPSLTEGMSNAVMEAMAAGLPVVATDVGGTAELLESRGELVGAADVHGLADAIGRLLGDPARARALGAAARQWARARLSQDAMVEKHIEIYREQWEQRCAA